MRGWVVGERAAADEGGGEAPGERDQDDGEDVVEDWRGWGFGRVGRVGGVG